MLIWKKEMIVMLTWLSRPFVFYLLLVLIIAYYLYDMTFGAGSGVAGIIDGSDWRCIEP
jgi:hypothetical protein